MGDHVRLDGAGDLPLIEGVDPLIGHRAEGLGQGGLLEQVAHGVGIAAVLEEERTGRALAEIRQLAPGESPLQLRGHPGRFLQSASALMGSGLLLGLLALPLLAWNHRSESTDTRRCNRRFRSDCTDVGT